MVTDRFWRLKPTIVKWAEDVAQGRMPEGLTVQFLIENRDLKEELYSDEITDEEANELLLRQFRQWLIAQADAAVSAKEKENETRSNREISR